jgi:hypothetical protein
MSLYGSCLTSGPLSYVSRLHSPGGDHDARVADHEHHQEVPATPRERQGYKSVAQCTEPCMLHQVTMA